MAVTATATINDRLKFVGGKKAVFADITLAGTYATGGFVLAATLDAGCASASGGLARVEMTQIDDIVFLDGCDTTGLVWQYTRSTDTIMLFECAAVVSTPLEKIGNGEATTGVMRCMVIGV